jgi:ATP-binding cassette subfamily F protein 3
MMKDHLPLSILSGNNLSLSFGDFDVFKGISVRIPNGGKIGLIGPNGVGKTSLLLILAGCNPPTSGSLSLARGRRIGYLRQEAIGEFAARSNTVFAEMLALFAPLQAEQEHLHRMEAEMAAGAATPELLIAYGSAQEAFARAGGYDYDLRIQQTLQGLGLGKAHWEIPMNQLSGGQQTRALLAKLLLENPDLLILDEPTNHLDAEASEWLERTLREWEGAVLVVSHDRYFLDNVVDTIWEMSRTGIEVYSGNYSAYLEQRQQRWEFQYKVYQEEKERLLKEIDFVQRNIVRASSNARAVGLLRRLGRDLAVIEHYGIMGLRNFKHWHETGLTTVDIGVVEAQRIINNLTEPSNRPLRLNLKLNAVHPSGNIVLRARALRLGYPGSPLFHIGELELRRGECVALIGPNGAGKTTFLKTLLGQLEPLGGQLHLGASLRLGYLAQAHDDLDQDNSVLDELLRHKDMPIGSARSYLAQYLFRGEDVFRPVSVLSGGERARLALAILALSGANFLLLDEPTNHLDIPAQEALQEVLENFQGTILLVSHDRYLIDRLATQIWDLRGGQLQAFKGTYRQFMESRSAGADRQALATSRPAPVARQAAPQPVAGALRANGKQARRDGQQALPVLETRIQQLEASLERLARQMQSASAENAFDRLHQLSWKYAQAQTELEGLNAEWEQLMV